jgi:predicted AAA+ superfamily ATPase
MQMSGLNIFEVKPKQHHTESLWVRGGFPESYLSTSDEHAMEWLEDLIRTYLERDLPQMGFKIPAARLRRLWTMIAHMQGENLNYLKLSTNLEVDAKTVRHYLDVLTDLLLVRRLEPWHSNIKKRLIKSPRYYIRDSGIQHRLLNINNHEALISNPVLGKSWEGFVIENILSILPRNAQTYYYRTAAGAEIDLVIMMPNHEIWAIEIKYGSSPKINKHFSRICDDIGATKKLIVYGGKDAFNIAEDVTMIPLKNLMEMITNITTS